MLTDLFLKLCGLTCGPYYNAAGIGFGGLWRFAGAFTKVGVMLLDISAFVCFFICNDTHKCRHVQSRTMFFQSHGVCFTDLFVSVLAVCNLCVSVLAVCILCQCACIM